MATNTGENYRKGPVKERSQVFNEKTQKWTKRDTNTGQFIDQKSDEKPFKGIRKENQK